MKKVILAFCYVLATLCVNSQAVCIKYISKTVDAEKGFCDYYFVFNNKQAILHSTVDGDSTFYYLLSTKKDLDTLNSTTINTLIAIDGKQNKIRSIHYNTKDNIIKNILYEKWQKISDFNRIMENNIFFNNFEFSSKKEKIKFIKSKETRQIGEYYCKSIKVKEGEEINTIWYSEVLNYNWIFFNDYRKLKGCIIAIEKKGQYTLYLESIKDINVEKEIIPYEILFKTLVNW